MALSPLRLPVLLVLIGVALSGGCQGFGTRASRPMVAVTDFPSWEEPVAAVFDAYCNDCHSTPPRNSAPDYFRTDAYDDRGSAAGVVSLFGSHMARITSPSDAMPPPSEGTVSAAEVTMLRRWSELGFPRTVEDALAAAGGVPPQGVPRCDPGLVAPCACAGGFWGRQACLDNGTFETCGCGGPADPDAGVDDGGAGPSLARVRADVFVLSCGGTLCHQAGGVPPDLVTQAGLRDRLLRTSLQARPMPLVTPGDPSQSYLYLKSDPDFAVLGVGSGAAMPSGQTPLDDAALTLLYEWIATGARP